MRTNGTGSQDGLVRVMRWTITFSLVIGFFLTTQRYADFGTSYAVNTAISIVAFWVGTARLDRNFIATLPFWVLILYFWIAYYIKFYWFALIPDVSLGLIPVELSVTSTIVLEGVFRTITLAAIGINATTWLCVGTRRFGNIEMLPTDGSRFPSRSIYFGQLTLVSLISGVALSVIMTIVTLRTGIGIMGVESPSLPFHLAGVVSLTRATLIPSLLLLSFWAAQHSGHRRLAGLSFFTLVGFGLVEMLLRSSRAALVPMVLSAAFVLILNRQVRRYRSILITCALMIAVLNPILSLYRDLRINNTGQAIGQLISSASSEVFTGEGSSVVKTAQLGGAALLLRATGAEMLIWYNALGGQPLLDLAPSALKSRRGVAGYLTVDVFGFAEDATTALAPGFVGWFYIIGGNAFVFTGLTVFTLLVSKSYALIQRLNLRTETVALALFLTWLWLIIVDGVLESLFDRTALVWPGTMMLCEYLARQLIPKGRINHYRRDVPIQKKLAPL